MELKDLLNCKGFAFDLEWEGENHVDNFFHKKVKPLTIAFCNDSGSFVLEWDKLTKNDKYILCTIFEDEKIKKVGHNIKSDSKVLTEALRKDYPDFTIKGLWFDTCVAYRLLDENESAKLENVIPRVFNREIKYHYPKYIKPRKCNRKVF